jgi:hypothetical protein
MLQDATSYIFFTDSPSIGWISKGGGPQISSANRKSEICAQNFWGLADLPQMWHFADMPILYFFADFKAPQICKYFVFLLRYKLKLLSFEFTDNFWLLGQFRDKLHFVV